MKTSCPVCRSEHLNSFLQRASVPVHQNLLFESRTAARSMPFGRLNMTACRECGFVFNSEFDPGLLSYGSSYDNSQHYSPAFVRHLEGLVDRLVNGSGVRNCTIVEVGCGKGDFLRRMAGPPEFGNTGIGFDPAYVGPDSVDDGRTQFRRTFYDAASARFSADVIICRHVIEHIPEPRILLNSVREALQSSPAARVFFETPCVEWILRNQVAWDFFYEHCSIFTAESLSRLFEECGFSVRKVDHVFGGQYLWLEGRLNTRSSLRVAATDTAQTDTRNRPATTGLQHATKISTLGDIFGQSDLVRNREWLQQISNLRHQGPLAIWGAGAKGVTLANLIDPQANLIDCIVDTNPAKQGRFLAGTGHEIVAPEHLMARNVRSVLVLNPNYCAEIRETLAGFPAAISVISLMQEGSMAA